MAQRGIKLDPKTFSCLLCQDLLKDPVSTNCGHSFCKECLHHYWDTDQELSGYRCPQCRRNLALRPVLETNAMLAAAVEILERPGLQAAPADHPSTEAEAVACDFCTGTKVKALKSCLICQASYCDPHLQPHRRSAAFHTHPLVKPNQDLQKTFSPKVILPKAMKKYCGCDEQTACSLCTAVLGAEPKSREDFQRHLHPLTLDVNTLNNDLLLSGENRKVTGFERFLEEPYCDHPERFTYWPQVLSKEIVSGRCYWEVNWSTLKEGIDVAVAYRSMSRAGESKECRFGFNNRSWSLLCYVGGNYEFYHNSICTVVSGPRSSTLGVYVDYWAGLLSFYSVSDSMTLLHRVETIFTEPLYAGLSLYSCSTAKLN